MHDRYVGANQARATNGIGMNITRIGKTIIPNPCRDLVLNNVLRVPSTNKNLISVHCFTLDNDTFIEFHPYFFLIKDRKMRKVLLHRPCKGGLYPIPPSSSFLKLVFRALKIPADRWHSRLGHPPVILFIESCPQITCHAQTLILLVERYVMHVHVPRLINCRILCLLVIHLYLKSSFFMYGVLRLILLVVRNIMSAS
jgi:hypothetical protein